MALFSGVLRSVLGLGLAFGIAFGLAFGGAYGGIDSCVFGRNMPSEWGSGEARRMQVKFCLLHCSLDRRRELFGPGVEFSGYLY